jgi:sugar transferase (PEP-CTERM system associated)
MTPGTIMFVLDAILIALAWPFATLLAAGAANQNGNTFMVVPGVLHPLMNLLFLYAMGLYRRDAILSTRRSLSRLPLAVVAGALAAMVIASLVHLAWPHRRAVPGEYAPQAVAAMLCFVVTGMAARLLFRALRRGARFRIRLMVIGAGARAWDLVWMLRSEGRNLSYDVTFVQDPVFGALDPRLDDSAIGRVVPAEGTMLSIAQRVGADEIVVAPDERRGMSLDGLIHCKTAGYPVLHYMSFLEKEIGRIDIKRLDQTWMLFSDGFAPNMLDRMCKRILDIVVSLLILGVAAPFSIPVMLAIRFGDPGPIFYSQERVTLGGRSFRILKLRTMRVDAEARGAVWAAKSDSRITRVGSFLRRSRIDEIPQLINVLKGDMSLVGPRPERPQFVRELAAQLPLYNERHTVKAGLTGWAQINYPYGASLDDARSKLSYDLYYVKNWGIMLDMMILLQTLRVVLWPSGVR